MPGLFANGSDLDRPMSIARPAAQPQAQQSPEAYTRQVYANLSRDEQQLLAAQERTRLLELGRNLSGFVQRDRRSEQLGFVYERTRGTTWPAEMPAAAAASVETSISADRTARSALDAAVMQFKMWEQQHPSASDERRRVKYEELTEDLILVAQRASEQLDQVLLQAGQLVETIEEWRHVESTADARRASAQRLCQQALDRIDTELMVARGAASRLGVKV